MARATRFRPKTTVHPFSLDRKIRPREVCGDSLSVIMAVGVVGLLLGGLAMNGFSTHAESPVAPTIVEARAG